jgi:hypothetical protein
MVQSGVILQILTADKAYASRFIKQELQESKVSLITPNKRRTPTIFYSIRKDGIERPREC